MRQLSHILSMNLRFIWNFPIFTVFFFCTFIAKYENSFSAFAQNLTDSFWNVPKRPQVCHWIRLSGRMHSDADVNPIFFIAQASGLKLIYHCATLSSTTRQHIYHSESTKALFLFDTLQLGFVLHFLAHPFVIVFIFICILNLFYIC